MRKGMVWAVALVATMAHAQDQGQGNAGGGAPPGQRTTGPTSDAFQRACVDLLNGRLPDGERAIKALRDACANLMSGRVDERLEAEKRHQQQLAAQEQLRAMAEGRPQQGGT